ncbi:MAG: hypothetical protein Q8928_15380 [Bacteroidota bacterium]|nr:hypothetical protein [Bacteroidota bacterium]
MKAFFKITCILLVGSFAIQGYAQKKIRIACIGNSITAGAGLAHPAQESYPGQLQSMLGSGYEVLNFGVSGKTAIRNCDRSYMATKQYHPHSLPNPQPIVNFILKSVNMIKTSPLCPSL